MIIDTDVLIWFLRGNQKAIDYILDATPFSISIVTYMELVRGMRDKRELAKMKKAFAEMSVEIIPLSESISLRASDYVEMYSLSHSMEMADALIAGTCIEENETLVTANDKHYRVVEGLRMTSSLRLLFPSCKTDILLVARYRSKVRVLRDEALSITVSATDRTESDINIGL